MAQRIYLIEDDTALRMELAHVLELSGYAVATYEGTWGDTAARALAAELKDTPIDVFVSSDLKRAFDTCVILAAAHGVSPDAIVQTKLLRVLQESVVERIGGTKPIPIDIRVICATNKNIEQMVEEGTFREDLYYRLNIIPIELPPLRKRKEDLPALIEYYIAYYNQKLGKSMRGVSPEALQTLTSYDWPGNVREMKNIIEYLENIAEGEIIQL